MELYNSVQVALTKHGADILNDMNCRLNERFTTITAKTDYQENDIFTTQLWNLFNIFGCYCSAGGKVVFTDLKQTK